MSSIRFITEDPNGHPKCVHGPSLLFERIFKGEPRKFFACSACRDRKDCSFFLWHDELHKHKDKIWSQKICSYTRNINHRNLFLTFTNISSLSQSQRIYCEDCQEFELPKHLEKHKEHELSRNITEDHLRHASEFLKPLDDSKKEAQYLFCKSSVKFIIEMLKKLNYKYVLCIGAPRIHEFIVNECQDEMESLLLDFDKRFLNFYSPLQFVWYNIFNHHFFLPESKQIYKEFLENSDSLAIITDPPFGGRVEPLAFTLNKILEEYNSFHKLIKEIPTFWVFPYFMEPQMKNSLPDFNMLDYKVDYDNHVLFSKGPKCRKEGSPVRIFTNVNLSLIELPESEGYRKCLKCDRWVSSENKHCDSCDNCPSKNGTTYVHCKKCKRCVKPTWKHCDTCKKCSPINHECSVLEFTQECFHCKKPGHKKRECPEIDHVKLREKRRNGEKYKVARKKTV